MQAVFLLSSKNFSEKQIGILFLAFGLSQFAGMTQAGYLLDYSNHKIEWVNYSGIITSILTVVTAVTAQDGGGNMGLMILLKIIQGGASAILPPGFNSVTLGIVGSTGFTVQVAKNRTMLHIGTALIVAAGSLAAYLLYPNIGAVFMVSPLTMIGVYYNMVRIKPDHVDRDAARALIIESPTMTEYEHLETQQSMGSHILDDSNYEGNEYIADISSNSSDGIYNPPISNGDNNIMETDENMKSQEMVSLENENPPTITSQQRRFTSASLPSFRFGWRGSQSSQESSSTPQKPRPRTPLAVLLDPTLVLFTLIVFCFHMANSSVLPLVMQSLAVEDEKSGILLSGMCILVGQGFMAWFAKICGKYSPKWGRKGLILAALSSLTVRCLLLTLLMAAADEVVTTTGSIIVKSLIISTQLLDSVGAGIMGTMHILVTNDISSRSGRFSLMMGITSSAMCLGATVSGYIGQSIAEDYGYAMAFSSLGALSLVPLLLYTFFMPETLPDYERPQNRKKRLVAMLKKLNEQRRRFFRRKNKQRVTVQIEGDNDKHEGLVPPSSSTTNPKTEFV
jgi:MFS family permease